MIHVYLIVTNLPTSFQQEESSLSNFHYTYSESSMSYLYFQGIQHTDAHLFAAMTPLNFSQIAL